MSPDFSVNISSTNVSGNPKLLINTFLAAAGVFFKYLQ